MKEYDERTPATEKGAVTQTTEASQCSERTDLLLDRLRDLRMGRRLPEGLTLEQRAALERIEAALETYKNITYLLVPANEAGRLANACRSFIAGQMATYTRSVKP
jgi:hypothetical protein